MANNKQVVKVANIVEKAPLADILDTVEGVMLFVPAVGQVGAIICKVLRILIKLQPAVTKTAHGIATTQPTSDSEQYTSFIPDGNSPELCALRTMVGIALEDGALSDEEQAMLVRKAEAAGIDTDLFVMGLKNELNKHIQ